MVSNRQTGERKGRRLLAMAICSRVVRYCSVCGAIWTIIFRRLAAKEHFTVSLGYRPATITDLKFSKLNKHGARPRRLLPEIWNGRLVSLVARRVTR